MLTPTCSPGAAGAAGGVREGAGAVPVHADERGGPSSRGAAGAAGCMHPEQSAPCSTSAHRGTRPIIIIWLLHNLVEASFDLFRYLLLGDQLKPWELHPLVL